MAHGSVDVAAREAEYRTPRLGQQDLDRNFAVAPSQILKWMQAARMDLPWLQNGYRVFGLLEPPTPTRRLVVAAQMVRLCRPGILTEASGREVVVRCEVGAVGRATIDFRYRILFGEEEVGVATATMVVVSGTPGSLRSSPVPEAVRALARPVAATDQDDVKAAFAVQAGEPPPGAYRVPIVVRYSDEDVNRHANHSALARFFEDAREAIIADDAAPAALRAAARRQLVALLVAYAAEVRAMDRCATHIALADPHTDGSAVLELWIVRSAPGRSGAGASAGRIVGRGRLVLGGGAAPDAEALRIGGGAAPAAPPRMDAEDTPPTQPCAEPAVSAAAMPRSRF